MKRGLYFVLAIKTGHSNFPKATTLAAARNRFDFALKTRSFDLPNGKNRNLSAASWMDKKEMMVVAFKGGRVQKVRYYVMQR